MSPDAPIGRHGYPCPGPWGVLCVHLAASITRQTTLQRCGTCGALWEQDDHSARRMIPAAAVIAYPDASIPPFAFPQIERATDPTWYLAYLNQGEVVRLYLRTTRVGASEMWSVVHGAVLRQLPALDEVPLIDVDRARFDDLIKRQWPQEAAAIQFAIETGLHPLVLKALDLVSRWGIAPTLTVGGTPESTADSLLRPLLDAEVVTVDDLRIEGYGWFGQA